MPPASATGSATDSPSGRRLARPGPGAGSATGRCRLGDGVRRLGDGLGDRFGDGSGTRLARHRSGLRQAVVRPQGLLLGGIEMRPGQPRGGLHRVGRHREAQTAVGACWPRPPVRSSAGCRTGRWSRRPRWARPCGRRRRSSRPCRSCCRRGRRRCSRSRRPPLARSTSPAPFRTATPVGAPLRRCPRRSTPEHGFPATPADHRRTSGSPRGQHQLGDQGAVVAAARPPRRPRRRPRSAGRSARGRWPAGESAAAAGAQVQTMARPASRAASR